MCQLSSDIIQWCHHDIIQSCRMTIEGMSDDYWMMVIMTSFNGVIMTPFNDGIMTSFNDVIMTPFNSDQTWLFNDVIMTSFNSHVRSPFNGVMKTSFNDVIRNRSMESSDDHSVMSSWHHSMMSDPTSFNDVIMTWFSCHQTSLNSLTDINQWCHHDTIQSRLIRHHSMVSSDIIQ